jgi:hypothetical protein
MEKRLKGRVEQAVILAPSACDLKRRVRGEDDQLPVGLRADLDGGSRGSEASALTSLQGPTETQAGRGVSHQSREIARVKLEHELTRVCADGKAGSGSSKLPNQRASCPLLSHCVTCREVGW